MTPEKSDKLLKNPDFAEWMEEVTKSAQLKLASAAPFSNELDIAQIEYQKVIADLKALEATISMVAVRAVETKRRGTQI